MNEEKIKYALNFFDIHDIEYEKNCIDAVNKINSDLNLKLKVKKVFDELFYNDDDNRYNMLVNKTNKELFDSELPFITNVIILLAVSIYEKNSFLFNKEIILKQKKRIKESLTKEKNMNVRQMVWISHFILGKIIEVGCLQFQLTNVTYMGCNIKIHIPRGVDLNITNVISSIKESKKIIKDSFKIDNPKYYCNSWMLGKNVRRYLNKDSNIYKFGNLFDIKENYESFDILRFVFNIKDDDYTKLQEDTRLQRSIKKDLLNNEKLYNGIGILK